MAQQPLELMNGQALLQDMGGIGMAQTMDATDPLDPGQALGLGKGFLRRTGVQCLIGKQSAREQPCDGPVGAPVIAQAIKQGHR